MKQAKKVLLLVLCAVLLVGASVAGTVAYLTDAEVVNNTFTVGDVEIYLDETDIDNSNTKYGYDALLNKGRDLANKYEGDNKLIPGRTVTKDPTVWVKQGSEAAYLRMIVTVGDYANLAAAVEGTEYIEGDMVVLSKLVGDWDYNTWQFVKFDKDTATYEFRYLPNDGIYTANTGDGYDRLPALFQTITIPSTLDNADIAKLANVTISVTAQAIQAAGFETTGAEGAWNAFSE